MQKPPRLQAGDRIGIVSPGAAVQADKLKRGCRVLRQHGFAVRVGAQALQRDRFFAGTDQARAEELTAMFTDPSVQAVFCSRAGYGSARLLPLLDFPMFSRRPKIFVGYSDATLLLNAFVQRAGLVCFHGPLVAGEFAKGLSARARAHLFNLLEHGTGEASLSFSTPLQTGVAEGPLVGGCLSVLVATLGTPFAFDPRGAILFLEDIGEKPYRIDRMLVQLKQGGVLEHIAGAVFGDMQGCWETEDDLTLLLSVIADAFAEYTYPVGFGLPAGHGRENFALPLGTRVRLDAGQQQLVFLESAIT